MMTYVAGSVIPNICTKHKGQSIQLKNLPKKFVNSLAFTRMPLIHWLKLIMRLKRKNNRLKTIKTLLPQITRLKKIAEGQSKLCLMKLRKKVHQKIQNLILNKSSLSPKPWDLIAYMRVILVKNHLSLCDNPQIFIMGTPL